MSNPYPQQQFAPQTYPPPPQQASGSGCGMGLLIGCLGGAVLCVLLCAGGIWWVSNNVGKLVAGVVRAGIVAVVNESELDAQEKTQVIAQIDRVVNAYKAGKLSNEELEKLFDELQDSPVFVLIQIYGTEAAYLQPSGLNDEEKAAGKRVFERVFRGINEKKIDFEDFNAAMPESMRPDPEDPGAERDPVSDEDLRTFLANLKKLADDAEIPDEPFEIDVSDELKKDVDKVLVGKE
jgi:hypothetical protein